MSELTCERIERLHRFPFTICWCIWVGRLCLWFLLADRQTCLSTSHCGLRDVDFQGPGELNPKPEIRSTLSASHWEHAVTELLLLLLFSHYHCRTDLQIAHIMLFYFTSRIIWWARLDGGKDRLIICDSRPTVRFLLFSTRDMHPTRHFRKDLPQRKK